MSGRAPRNLSAPIEPGAVRFREIDLDRHAEVCIRFRLDSYVVSFGSTERFFADAGPEAQTYLARLRRRSHSLPGSCVHLWLRDRIVGQLELQLDRGNPRLGYVALFYLEPAARGSGLGGVLHDYVCGFFRNAGCVRMMLRVSPANSRAVAYYRKHGWVDLGQDPAHPEVHRMQRELA